MPESRIVIYGHSLGSAVAVHLASREHPAGLILEGALISIAARGRELCPFLPVGLMVRNRFDTWTAIESVRCPKLFLHGNQDRLVPIAHGRYLYDHASPPKTWLELNGDHGTSIDDPRVPQALRAFVDSLPK